MKASYDQLYMALSLAVDMLSKNEPGDSRAVSDEFVAIAAVQCGLVDEAVMNVIINALKCGHKGE